MDEKYLQQLYADLQSRYGNDKVIPYNDFSTKVKSDPNYQKQLYDDISSAYGKDKVIGYDDFTQKVRAEKQPAQPPHEQPQNIEQHYDNQKFLIDQLLPKTQQPRVTGDIQSLPSVKHSTQDNTIATEGAARTQATKELKNEAIVNTVKRKHKNLGIEVDENSKLFKNDVDLTKKALKEGSIALVPDKDGNISTTKSASFKDALINTIIGSVKAPIDAYKINKINNPKDLSDQFEYENATTPDVPESVNAGWTGKLGEIFGGSVAPAAMLAINAIPGAGQLGTGMFAAESAMTKLAAKKREIYNLAKEKLIHEGQPEATAKIRAAQVAMDDAGLASLPGVAADIALVKGIHNESVPVEYVYRSPATQAFKKTVNSLVSGTAKMAAVGGAAKSGELAVKQAQGFDVSGEEALKGITDNMSDYSAMHAALTIAHNIKAYPKTVIAAAKEVLHSLPPEVVAANTTPEVAQSLSNYSEARSKVPPEVPQENMPHIAGLIEKQDAIQKEIKDLQNKKMTVHPALTGEFNDEIKALQEQSKAIDGQLEKMAKSNNPSVHEVDDLTGERPIDVKNIPDETTPEQTNPTNQSEQAADLAENSGAVENNATTETGSVSSKGKGGVKFTDEQKQDYTSRGFELNDNGIWVHKGTHPAVKKLLNGWLGKLYAANGGTHAGSIHKEGSGIAGSMSKFKFKTGKQNFIDLVFGKDKTEGDYADTVIHELGHGVYEKLTPEEQSIVENNKHLTQSAESHKANRERGGEIKNNASDAEESFSDYATAFIANKLFGIEGEDFNSIPKEILPILERNINIPETEFSKPNSETTPEQTNSTEQGRQAADLAENSGAATIDTKVSKDYNDKSDAELEKRMNELEGAKSFTPESKEYSDIEKEMQKRERSSVFNIPLEKVNGAVDALMRKEKEQPNGYGAFIEKKDAGETKSIARKYLKPEEISNEELITDFKNALLGNPDTWYADGLKLREAAKESANRGIRIEDLLKTATDIFVDDGYDLATAKKVVAKKLQPIFEGSQQVNEKQLDKPITPEKAAIDHKEATDLGFNNVYEAMGSVNKRTGEKYTKFQDIPKDVLEKVSKDRQVQPVKEFVSKQGHTLRNEDGILTVRNKEGKEVSRGTRTKVIKEAAESYDFTKGSTSPDPDFEPANQEEHLKHVIEKTTSPVELANIYLGEEKVGKGLSTKEQMIADYGMGKVTEDSYRNFADKNSQNHNKSRAYFSKDGSPIDALAKEMSDHYGVDISPEDVTGFIDRFPNGAESAAAMNETGIAKEAKDRFSELTGLPLTEDIADIAVNQHFEKLSKEAQEIAQQDYETEQQLRDEYDRYLAEQDNADNAAKETSTGEVGDGAGEEAAKTTRHYEEIAGSKPTKTGRVSVDPIIGATPKNVSEIISDISKSLSQKVSFSKPGSRKAIGTYAPGSTGIKIRYNGDLDTTAHEIGHSLDDAFGIISDLKTTPNKILEAELKKFSPFGSTPPKGHSNPRMYKLGEGFAEWLRAKVVNPAEAIRQAPELNKIYEAKVSSKFKKAIDDFSTDVRTWAGATGRDITLANIEWKPEEAKGLLKKLFSKKENTEGFALTFADKLAAEFVNPMHAFEKAWDYARDLKGIGDVLPEDDPTILSRLLLSVDSKAGEFLKNGMRDTNDTLLKDKNGEVKNFKWLIEPLDNSDQVSIQNEMKDTIAYMVSERTVELSKKFERQDVLSGVGGGVYKDIDVAQKTLDEFNNGDPKKLVRIKEAAERYRSFSNDILQYLADKGRMEQRMEDKDGNLIGGIDFIKENNLQYVAMRRIVETEPDREIEVFKGSGGRLTSVSEPVKTIKGSTKEIVNPYLSLLDTLFKSIKEADRNDVLRAFREVLVSDRKMYDGEPVKLADVAVKGATGDKNTITIFVDGKPEKWLLQEDIYKALKGLDHEAYRLPNLLRLNAKVLRATVTKFPTFALRNIIRDTPDRIIKSTDGSGLKDFFGKKEDWNDIARNGGLNAGYYVKSKEHYYGMMEEAIASLSKKGNIVADANVLKRAWEGYESILQKSETLNRVAEYRAAFREAKKKGMDGYNASLYASFKSRDLMDFALMGHTMKIINQVVPFSNAAVQGLRSTYNSAIKNPVSFAARVAIYTVLPQVVLWGLNHRDDETAKQYEEMPDFQRDMFWNFKLGPNKWFAAPKPYELGLIAAGVDRSLSKAFKYNDKAFDGLAGETFKTLSPIDQSALTNSFTPELELLFNKSLFSGKHIIPANEEPLDISLRNVQNASRLGQSIQNIAGLDARKTDYWIKAHFSYLGDAALKASNVGDDTKQGFDLTTTGLIKRTPAYNSKSVQDFLDFIARWDLGRAPQAKVVKTLAHDYFVSKDDVEKEKIAAEMIKVAKSSLEAWEPKQEAGKLKSQIKKEKHDTKITAKSS